ncbi:hypothetical protein N7528_001083 [Penicillium herquei]|nr:hypothetical protein N7528_001083 [Penicillium herquei]
MDNLTLAMQNIDFHDEPEQLEQLLFRPQGKPATSLDIIPRYLFRVVSPKSDRETNERWVKSVSACCDEESSREDIFSNLDANKRATVANRLNLQLQWWPKSDCRDAHFVSWTSSLLFAIQYIYYRSKDPKDGSSFEDIDLYVIDTSKFPRGTFMRDMDLIEAFCDYHDRLKKFQSLRKLDNYYFGEYLSQGALKIENKCQRIPGHILLQNDRLHRIQPEFDTVIAEEREKPRWPKKVIYLRGVIRPSGGLKLLTSVDMGDRLQAIKEILEDITPHWQFPIAIYLAALMGAKLSTLEFEQGQISKNPFFEFFQSEFAGGL